ncbi:hypothetical protein BSNK01_04040 [Bacillaceae bacterium]
MHEMAISYANYLRPELGCEGVKGMTVSSQVKQAIATLKGAEATLMTYAQRAQKAEVRDICEKSAHRIKNIVDKLERRVQKLEFEEPQYKGY